MKPIILAAMLGLAACVSSGAQVKEEQLAQFQKGRTTINDVVNSLGPPTSSMLLPNGSRIIAYSFVQTQPRPETFIPVVGAFVGGADSRSSVATLTFDRAGVLENYAASSSRIGTGSGVAAGATMQRTPYQPRQASD